jgi:Cu/Ag efflux pump CusA
VFGPIVRWSLRFRFLLLGLAAALLILGALQIPKVPVDALPEFTPPYVEVQTEALGLSAEEVEQLITVPLEADLLHGVAWLEEIRSESIAGLSSIILTFEPGTDVIRARQMVAERLTQAHALPNVSKPPIMLQPLSSTSRVMMVGLSSDDVSLIDMSVLARWVVRPRLLGVEGVANVAIWGQRDRQLQVLVDPERLRQERVRLQQVIESVGNALWASPLTFIEAATPGTGGFIDTPNQRIGIQHVQPIRGPEDMAAIPVEEKPGVVIGDVATVVEDHQPLIGDAVVEDGDGLVLVIEKFPDANTLEVTARIEAALAALQPGLSGISVDPTIFRPASFIESAAGNVVLALVLGLVLLALVVGILLDWRGAVLALVTIPLSLAAAMFVLVALGATVNAMVVAGLILAVGVIVDDVVVGTESVVRRFRTLRDADSDTDRPVGEIIVQAIVEGRSALIYATVLIVLVALPVAFVAGSAAAFLPDIAIAYVLAVLASLVVALTVGPALTSLLVWRRPDAPRETGLGRRLAAGYGSVVASLVRRSRIVVAGATLVAVAVAVVAVVAFPGVGRSIAPAFQERDLLITWQGSPSTSRTEMHRILARAGAELRTVPGVRNVGGHVGRAITSDQVVNPDAAELWVGIADDAEYASTLGAIQEVVAGYPGLGRAVTTYSAERISDVLGDTRQDVVVRLYGQDQAVLRAKAVEVRDAMSTVEGVASPAVLAVADQPTLNIRVDPVLAAGEGLKPGDIRRAATSLLSGIGVGFLFEDQKVFEVVVWGTPALRESLSSVGDLLIDTPDGTQVRLADVADVSIAPSPTVIQREGVMRVVDVGATIDGRDQGAVLADVDAALAGIAFPLEYHAEVRGVAAERQDDQLRLVIAVLAAVLGAFLVLQASFGSWRLAAMTLITMPAALVGGVLAGFAVGGGDLPLGALVGLFAVLAIAVRNGITLIAHYQDLERQEGERDATESASLDLVVRGAQDRLTPILVTALGTTAAVAPFIVLGDLAGFEIIRPMAVVILGGLISSTLLTLFIMPAVYRSSGPSPEAASVNEPVEQPAMSPA